MTAVGPPGPLQDPLRLWLACIWWLRGSLLTLVGMQEGHAGGDLKSPLGPLTCS